VTLDGATVQERFVELVETARFTVEEKPLTGATVIVEPPATLVPTVTLVGLADIVKSTTVKTTVAVCERLPIAPVTVTVTVAATVNVHDSVELPNPPVTVDGVRVHAVLSPVSATLPAKPFFGETVILDVPAELTSTVTVDGAAVRVKSVTVRLKLPLLPPCPVSPG
jgi:hypothetical protein